MMMALKDKREQSVNMPCRHGNKKEDFLLLTFCHRKLGGGNKMKVDTVLSFAVNLCMVTERKIFLMLINF
jgi:hypothetical protein